MSVRDDRPARTGLRAALACAAVALAAAALLAGEAPDDRGIEPLALAQRIRDREPGLRVLDARGAAADPSLAVPAALFVDPGAPAAWPLDSARAIVVYGIDDAASRAARDAARSAGRADARHLEGGLAGWVDEVLEPVLPVPVTARDSSANDEIAGLSRYFGGLPRVAAPGEDAIDAADRVRRAARRGCGPRF